MRRRTMMSMSNLLVDGETVVVAVAAVGDADDDYDYD
jgi:hypothetical protein